MTAKSVELFVAPARLDRWTHNFVGRHGATAHDVVDGALVGSAQDGSHFEARLPFGRTYAGPADVALFVEACLAPDDWGLLLVRKGGFAVSRLCGPVAGETKIGQRHVQGRSKAGGWSQQRFARRRENQAKVAYEAAAGHARRILGGVDLLVTGGDGTGVDAVVELAGLQRAVVDHLGDVAEPRRGVFEETLLDACSVRMAVTNA